VAAAGVVAQLARSCIASWGIELTADDLHQLDDAAPHQDIHGKRGAGREQYT
jgi:hypothetical protein